MAVKSGPDIRDMFTSNLQAHFQNHGIECSRNKISNRKNIFSTFGLDSSRSYLLLALNHSFWLPISIPTIVFKCLYLCDCENGLFSCFLDNISAATQPNSIECEIHAAQLTDLLCFVSFYWMWRLAIFQNIITLFFRRIKFTFHYG